MGNTEDVFMYFQSVLTALSSESSEIQIIGNISSRPFLFNFKCPEEEQVSLYLLKFPVSIGCGFSSPPSPH